jgi:hypothetical protein
MEREFLKKSRGLLRDGVDPVSKYRLIVAEKAHFEVTMMMCRLLEVGRTADYAWVGRPASARAVRAAALAARIAVLHEDSGGAYGAPRILADLRTEGEVVSVKPVAKSMRVNGLRGCAPAQWRTTTIPEPDPANIATGRVERNFDQGRLDAVWVGDVTYIRTWEGWLYLATVIDAHSRRVIGWAVTDHMRASLVTDALTMAIVQRGHPVAGVIFHSDCGVQGGLRGSAQQFLYSPSCCSARELRLDQKHQSLGQYAVILHRVGHRLVLHRGHHDVQVSNVHQHRDLGAVLRVDEGPDVGDPERPEDLFALRRGKPVVGVLHIVVPDDGRHDSSLGWGSAHPRRDSARSVLPREQDQQPRTRRRLDHQPLFGTSGRWGSERNAVEGPRDDAVLVTSVRTTPVRQADAPPRRSAIIEDPFRTVAPIVPIARLCRAASAR